MSTVKKVPWLKFHANDWLSDPHLRMCSPASHGLLINLIALAHNAEPYGHLVNGGTALTPDDVRKYLAWPYQTVRMAWADLAHHGRITQASDGHWFIKRMVADNAYSLQQSEFGKNGGNPTLKAPLKPEQNRADKIRTEESREDTTVAPAPKISHGEFNGVKLTAEEHAKLCAKQGAARLDMAIDILDSYMRANGKRYKDHYAVLKETSWVWQRVDQAGGKKADSGLINTWHSKDPDKTMEGAF